MSQGTVPLLLHPRVFMSPWLAVIIALELCVSAALRAQGAPSIVVKDSSGERISDAIVEIYRGDSLLVVVRAPNGTAAIPRDLVALMTRVRIRRLGYAPTMTPTDPRRYPIEVTLARLPHRLREVDVTSLRAARCPVGNDRDARVRWLALRTNYRAVRYDTGISYLVISDSISVKRSMLGKASAGSIVPNGMSIGAGKRAADSARIAKVGYATRSRFARQKSAFPSKDWTAARLDLWMAEHFVDDLFGQLHVFYALDTSRAAVTFRFCPRRRGVVEIEGSFTVRADGFLRSVDWHLLDEQGTAVLAGGRVEFAGPDPDSSVRFLTPESSLAWGVLDARRNLYWQRSLYVTHWSQAQSQLPVKIDTTQTDRTRILRPPRRDTSRSPASRMIEWRGALDPTRQRR